jgi:hypothetical protein
MNLQADEPGLIKNGSTSPAEEKQNLAAKQNAIHWQLGWN